LKCENKDEIMVTENVSNNAEACREKPKKWDETYKVDFVNNIDVDSIQNLEIQLENLNIENVVQSDIDTLVGKLGEICVLIFFVISFLCFFILTSIYLL
jgi:hypothetical protein